VNGLSVTLRREKRRSTAQALLDAVERLAWIDGWIGALCLAALIVLMLTEVTLRALSNVIPGIPAGVSFTWEYCSYLMAACFTFGAAMTLRTGGHIRVNLLFGHLEPRMRKALEIAGSAIGLGSV
jgi:TRAP-type C4-dicarboxylate transport system permease small subunit